jgi:hypothetical protein
VVRDQAHVAEVVSQVDAAGARLLSVQPVRRSLEEIFLEEVGQTQPGQGPDDVQSTVSSLLDAVGESAPIHEDGENSKSVEIPS